MAQEIYFDESGFTGSNLLNPNQRFFAYASVATDEAEAKAFVERLVIKYRIQNNELKGSRLVKYHNGRKAITEIFDHFAGRIKISVSDKKYALACKLFEYIFEPCLADSSSLFYDLNFHRFIANILFLEFSARGAGAEEIFNEFEGRMRRKDLTGLEEIFSSSVHPENSPMLSQVREFAQLQATSIRAELASMAGIGASKWVLDLTNTALFTLLASWGLKYDTMIAICDSSKPLMDTQSVFDSMIGRDDRIFTSISGSPKPITFNLARPIKFADSKTSHGIQLADAVAAASVYVFSNGDDCDHSRQWAKTLMTAAQDGSILPEETYADPKEFPSLLNALILSELHERARRGQSLTQGMNQFICTAATLLPEQATGTPSY